LTMAQMGGVLVMAVGIPGLFEGKFTAGIVGYVVMRLALCAQWLRAARGDPLRRRTCLRYAGGVALVQVGWVLYLLAVNAGMLSGSVMWALMVVGWVCELAVPVWAERAGETPWHAHHIAERYSLMLIIVLGECVLGATNDVAALHEAQGWSFDLALMGFAGTLLIFCLWWMYFLLPSADALHHHRERAWGWGYGHYVLFASVAAIGAGLEVVADVLKSGLDAAGAHAAGAAPGHGVSALQAIGVIALAEGVFVVSLWALYCYVSRALDRQVVVVLAFLGLTALGPLAVAHGLPLPWGLLLLCAGPLMAIAYNEHGRLHRAERMAPR
ncbi:MAG: low temperature requirement protein A, partial [Burkholderiaceae bacterium]